MKKYFIILNILLIAAAIYFGVKASYQMLTAQIDEKSISAPKTQNVVTSENETILPQSDYTAITERNLFKTKEKEEPAPPPPEPVKVEEPVKLTELKLKLWGTVSGNDRNKSYAVIEDTKERKQNLYREGDSIPVDKAKVVVKEILRQRIILTVNDQDEALEMGENQGEEPKRPEHPMASVLEQPPPSSSNSNIKLERSKIEEAMNNVNNLMRQAKIRPHFKDGKPDGLTLSRIQENSIFSELGLQSGDIIVGVDGKKIESVDDALKFYQSLRTSPSVNLEIKRRGETKSIDYTIE